MTFIKHAKEQITSHWFERQGRRPATIFLFIFVVQILCTLPPTPKNIDYINVKNLKEGDSKAFDTLYNKYSAKLFNFSLKYLKDEEAAGEVVQEVFLYVWDKRDALKPDLSFNAYIFTIAYNIIRKHFNKRTRDNAYKDTIISNLLKEENSLDELIDYKFLLRKVELVIDAMPLRRKEIFMKRKYQELSVKQIAEELSISISTVENQLSAAQKYLYNELRKHRLPGLIFFMLFVNE